MARRLRELDLPDQAKPIGAVVAVAAVVLALLWLTGGVSSAPHPRESPTTAASSVGPSGGGSPSGQVGQVGGAPAGGPTPHRTTPGGQSSSPEAPVGTTGSAMPPGFGASATHHLWWVFLENHEFSEIVGSDHARFLNDLATRYGLATNYYAVGHPSQPNYIAATSGATQGIRDDGMHQVEAPNLFSQLYEAGIGWRAYEQGYPGGCFNGYEAGPVEDGPGATGSYVRHHDPAITFSGVSGEPVECANIQPFSGFDPGAAPFELIVPNLQNDMHDGSIRQGDDFLRTAVGQITASSAFADGGLLFVTFDEGRTDAGKLGDTGGHVATFIVAPGIPSGYRASAYYDHYNLLRTAEDIFGLPCLGTACSRTAIAY